MVRSFNAESDYAQVASWWKQQNWPALPVEVLSKSGFVAEKDGVLLAATWVFATNCPIYIMEWTVGNPNVDWETRQVGIAEVTEAGCQWAKQDGAAQVFTMTKSDRFIDKLEQCGFTKADTGMTHLVRRL